MTITTIVFDQDTIKSSPNNATGIQLSQNTETNEIKTETFTVEDLCTDNDANPFIIENFEGSANVINPEGKDYTLMISKAGKTENAEVIMRIIDTESGQTKGQASYTMFDYYDLINGMIKGIAQENFGLAVDDDLIDLKEQVEKIDQNPSIYLGEIIVRRNMLKSKLGAYIDADDNFYNFLGLKLGNAFQSDFLMASFVKVFSQDDGFKVTVTETKNDLH